MMCVRTERTECRVKNIKIQCQNHSRFFSNFCCQFYFHQIFNCFDNIFRSRKRDTMRVCGHFRRPHFTSLIFGLQGGYDFGISCTPRICFRQDPLIQAIGGPCVGQRNPR